MYKKNTIVKCKSGLHARPGTEVAECAMSFNSNIKIIKDDIEIDCKEILEIMSSDINMGDQITIMATGDDEKTAVEKIVALIESLED